MSLIPEEQLRAAQEKYSQVHPEPPRPRAAPTNPVTRAVRQVEDDYKAKVLVEEARKDSSVTVQEFAEASERRPAWVRRVLRANGIVAPEATKIKSPRNCLRCGHTRKRHCDGVRVPRLHRQKRGYSLCPGVRHCAIEGCPCKDFVKKGTNLEAERLEKERQFNAIPSFNALMHLAFEEIQPIRWPSQTHGI
jgi:hypothetical protein